MQSAITGAQPSMGGGSGATTTMPDNSATSPYYAPPPGADQIAQGSADATLAYQRALARFNQQRTGLLQQYGYKGTVDPNTGLMTNVGVDEANSYGQLQQLLHGQALEDQNADYAAQDRGLVGGLAHQASSELAYAHHGQSSDLAKSLFGNLSDLNSQQADAKTTLDQTLWQLTHSATQDAIDTGNYDPTNVGPDTGGDTGGGTGGGTGAAAKAKAVARYGTIPKQTANRLVARAIAKGQPVSEHGLGMGYTPKPVAKRAPKRTTYKGRH